MLMATDETIFVLDGDVRMLSNWTLHVAEASVDPAALQSAVAEWRDRILTPTKSETGDGSN